MFHKDGMDYGPFSVRDIEKMIDDGTVLGPTEIINYRSKVSAPVSEVPHFAKYLADKVERDRIAAHNAEVERDTNTAIRQTKRRYTMPLIIGCVLAVAGSTGAWLLLRDPEIPTSGYPVTFFRELEFPMAKPMKQRLASPVEVTREEQTVRRGAARPRSKPAGYSEPGVVEAPLLDMSWEASGDGATRELTQEDIDGLKQSVTQGLIRCFQNEVANVEGFKGGKVVFYVMPKGKVALSRVDTNPAASSALVGCVTSTINTRRVRPYAGDIQIIEFPLHVSIN